MPPIPRRQLVRRSSSSNSRYAIIFAVLGSVVLLGGVLWGYWLPRWRRKHQRPVQTRYNSIEGTRKQHAQSDHDLELPVIFPPHPAVVLPLNKKRQPKDPGRVPCSSSIPVYDPRTQSPFPNTLSAGCSRPLTADISSKYKSVVPETKPTSLHAVRLRRSQSHNTPIAIYGSAFPGSRSTSVRRANTKYVHNNSTNNGGCSFLIARSAGAPPARSKAAGKVPEGSRHRTENRRAPTTFAEDTQSAIAPSRYQHQSERDRLGGCECNVAAGVKDKAVREQMSRDRKGPLCTPFRSGFYCHDIFETPSSRGTITTTRFDSSTNRVHVSSTPPTGPNSSIIQPQHGISPYPGISKLVPSRKFSHHIATTKARRTPSADVVLEGSSVSFGDAHESNHPFVRGHRPLSGIVLYPYGYQQY